MFSTQKNKMFFLCFSMFFVAPSAHAKENSATLCSLVKKTASLMTAGFGLVCGAGALGSGFCAFRFIGKVEPVSEDWHEDTVRDMTTFAGLAFAAFAVSTYCLSKSIELWEKSNSSSSSLKKEMQS